MRGSSLAVVTTVPEMETQSWEEEFWKVIWAVLSWARSENLLECLLARKRKSGPSRCEGVRRVSFGSSATHARFPASMRVDGISGDEENYLL